MTLSWSYNTNNAQRNRSRNSWDAYSSTICRKWIHDQTKRSSKNRTTQDIFTAKRLKVYLQKLVSETPPSAPTQSKYFRKTLNDLHTYESKLYIPHCYVCRYKQSDVITNIHFLHVIFRLLYYNGNWSIGAWHSSFLWWSLVAYSINGDLQTLLRILHILVHYWKQHGKLSMKINSNKQHIHDVCNWLCFLE